MLKKITACLCLVAGLMLMGCKKDDQMREALKDLDTFTTELVQKVETGGVDEGQKFMDSKKADIKAKLDSIKDIREFQVSEETKKFMTDTLIKDLTAVMSLQTKYVSKSVADPAFKSKLEKLVADYRALLPSA
jgi:outer membrane lipoprotein-sorting protein